MKAGSVAFLGGFGVVKGGGFVTQVVRSVKWGWRACGKRGCVFDVKRVGFWVILTEKGRFFPFLRNYFLFA